MPSAALTYIYAMERKWWFTVYLNLATRRAAVRDLTVAAAPFPRAGTAILPPVGIHDHGPAGSAFSFSPFSDFWVAVFMSLLRRRLRGCELYSSRGARVAKPIPMRCGHLCNAGSTYM